MCPTGRRDKFLAAHRDAANPKGAALRISQPIGTGKRIDGVVRAGVEMGESVALMLAHTGIRNTAGFQDQTANACWKILFEYVGN